MANSAVPTCDSEPLPCGHCGFCEFADRCESEWRDRDALHFIAGIRAGEQDDLGAAGVVTMAIAVTTLLTSSGYLVQGAPLAIAPGVLLATGVALRPPPPSQLRRVGWVLVAVSAATMLALVGVIRASA